MDLYKLMVVHWSIFTLSIQLIYCASVYSNVDSVMTESLCNPDVQLYMREKEIDSSLILNLHPQNSRMPCKTILTAPESHGFFVRLYKQQQQQHQQQNPIQKSMHGGSISSSGSSSSGISSSSGTSLSSTKAAVQSTAVIATKAQNANMSCPLNIVSTSDPLTPPWKLDPCMMEAQGAHDEPVRLLPGRLKIVWNHGGNMPMYKLIVTSLGKGYECAQKGKHPCLKFGQETMLCVSDKLICDGIRHCPAGNEYDSDEDAEMCLRFRSLIDTKSDNSIKKQPTAMNGKKVISHDVFHMEVTMSTSTTEYLNTDILTTSDGTPQNPVRPSTRNRHENRNSLTRGLSRYGPWGYLMLGMLLCGGALLVCGLWECCCRNKKTSEDDPNDRLRGGMIDGHNNISTISMDQNSTINSSGSDLVTPPNYDEIDPPPSYATLFPNPK